MPGSSLISRFPLLTLIFLGFAAGFCPGRSASRCLAAPPVPPPFGGISLDSGYSRPPATFDSGFSSPVDSSPCVEPPVDGTDFAWSDPSEVFTESPPRNHPLIESIIEDHRNYYSPHNLGLLGSAFGIGAVVANTSLDHNIIRHIGVSIDGATSDDWKESLHSPKNFGNGVYTLPVFALAWGLGSLNNDRPLGAFAGEWGERSLRAFLVGAPPTVLMQRVTGAGRPGESESHWHFWNDNNGVSGHAFMGSLPFLTAAQTVDDRFMKCLLYAGSVAVPVSRVTDGDHYPSQAFLGWCMAWSASLAVDATQDHDTHWRTVPLIGPGYSGLALEHRW